MTKPTDYPKTTTPKTFLLLAVLLLGSIASAQIPTSCNRADFLELKDDYRVVREIVFDQGNDLYIQASAFLIGTDQAPTRDELMEMIEDQFEASEQAREEVLVTRRELDRLASGTDYRLWIFAGRLESALFLYMYLALNDFVTGDVPLDEAQPDDFASDSASKALSASLDWLSMADLSCRLDQAGIE